MDSDSGVTVAETLIALVIVSIAIYALSSIPLGNLRTPTLSDAKRFVSRAQIDAINGNDALVLQVTPNAILMPKDQTIFQAEGLSFRATPNVNPPQDIVIFPDGAFSGGIFARDKSGHEIELTPVVTASGAQKP